MPRTRVEVDWQRPYTLRLHKRYTNIAREPAVYAIFSTRWPSQHGRGEANEIIYIGETDDARRRMQEHSDPNSERGDPDVMKMLKKHERHGYDLKVSIAYLGSKGQARCAEADLLKRYRKRYGEYPCGNAAPGRCPMRFKFVGLRPMITRRDASTDAARRRRARSR